MTERSERPRKPDEPPRPACPVCGSTRPQPFSATSPNDLAAVTLLARALTELSAALHLSVSGFHSEIASIIRGPYESAGLARVLAKDPDLAERWLREGTWVPDRQVRGTLD